MIEVKHLKTLQALRNCGSLAAAARRCIKRNPPCLTSLAIWNNALASGYLCVKPAASVYTAGRNPVATGESGAAANQPGTASLQ